ncbi:MAG: ABC transporter substrate-binding protein [Candidatus Poribacteria bacterium]|nr:ABC transporter substrate-binding protein [Candidatus Poribacteria bacterium]
MTYRENLKLLRREGRIVGLIPHPVVHFILVAAMLMLFSGCEEAQRILTSLPDGEEDVIKIGFIYSSTNRSHSLNGAELAERKLNAEGGVHGTPIRLVARGNITGDEHAVEIAEALIVQEGVSAIIGPNLSRYAVPIGEVAQTHGIPMVTTTATNPTVTAAGDFVFMSAFTDDFQGKVMAQFAAQDLEAKTAAVLTRSASLYSGGLSQTFIDNFTAFGGEVVNAEFYARGDTDFTAQLTSIAESAPDVFFLPGFSAEIPLVVEQARTLGITGILLGGDSWDNAALIAQSGAILEGSYFSTFFWADVPPGSLSKDAHQFIDTYTSIFGIPPDGGAALGYDALRLTVQAMRRAPELTHTEIRDQIAATKNYSGATFISGYDDNRHAAKSAFINRIIDGEARFHKLIQP